MEREAANRKSISPLTDVVVGLSRPVRFWSPRVALEIGLALRDLIGARGQYPAAAPPTAQTAGLADPPTGPAIWYKPGPNTTHWRPGPFMRGAGGRPRMWAAETSGRTTRASSGDAPRWSGSATPPMRKKLRVHRPVDSLPTPHPPPSSTPITGSATLINDATGAPSSRLDYETQGSWTSKTGGVLRRPQPPSSTAGLGVIFKYYGNQSITVRYSGG